MRSWELSSAKESIADSIMQTYLESMTSSSLDKDLGSRTWILRQLIQKSRLQEKGKLDATGPNNILYLYLCNSLYIKKFLCCRPKHLLKSRASIDNVHSV